MPQGGLSAASLRQGVADDHPGTPRESTREGVGTNFGTSDLARALYGDPSET